MPWGAIVGAVISAHGAPRESAPRYMDSALNVYPRTVVRTRREGVRRRAERMARKRMFAIAKPWLIAAAAVAGLWFGYQLMLWVLWWGPHPLQLTPFSYGH